MSQEALLLSVMFVEEYRTFKEGDKFDFKPGVNLIVGDQGVGKSSLVNLLGKYKKDKTEIEIKTKGIVPSKYIDMEQHNPRMQPSLNDRMGIMSQIAVHFKSHGEVMMGILGFMEKAIDEEQTIWIVDECDAGLSIRSCYMLAQMFKKLAEKGHQVIAVVYSQTIMEEFDEVLSIEHKKWMSSKAFIKSHKK